MGLFTYYFQKKKMIRAQILNFFILSTSIAMILLGIIMISYCSILITPPITVIDPYILYGFLISMGIFGIRFFQLEGSFNVNLNSPNIPAKTMSKALPKPSRKISFTLFKKPPVREISSLESIKELKIPKMNLEKDQTLPEFDILSLPKMEEDIFSGDKTIYEYLNKTINQAIKEIQEIIQFSKLPESKLLLHKEDAFRAGMLFEEEGDAYSAIANYSIAYEIAKDLELDEEVIILNQSIHRLLQHFSAKEEMKLRKKFHLV